MDEKTERAETRGSFGRQVRPWAPIVVAGALLSAYSCKDGPAAPVLELSWRDKLDHFCVYGLLATLVFQALPSRIRGTKRWLGAFFIVCFFGLWDETLQYFNPARTGDPLDWLADSLGALLAVVACTTVPCIQKFATWPCVSIYSKNKSARRDESTTGQLGV